MYYNISGDFVSYRVAVKFKHQHVISLGSFFLRTCAQGIALAVAILDVAAVDFDEDGTATRSREARVLFSTARRL